MKNKTISAAGMAKGLLFVTTAFALPQAALADTTGTDLNVSATVTKNCVVSTSNLNFGNLDTTSSADQDGSATLTVKCTAATGWTASAGFGTGSTSFTVRKMASGANRLDYNLYTDAARSTIWGDGVSATGTIGGTGTGVDQTATIYGRIPGGQTSVPAGDYADTVSVTLTY